MVGSGEHLDSEMTFAGSPPDDKSRLKVATQKQAMRIFTSRQMRIHSASLLRGKFSRLIPL
jgi:hypothetical protein